jgi:carbonic anhydrase/acetyltransferase-like protein (isoleucine patch superfamily)
MPLYELGGQQPQLASDAWVAPSADLIGDVRLAELASVWFGAVIRADNTPILIGARTNIQDGAMLHSDPGAPCTLGDDVTVGHHAILHGCTIGDRVLIGMGATVLNRAVIAEDCLIGAGALITEGKTFPSGHLIVGSPARAIRPLDDAQRAMLKASAALYAAKQRDYATELREVVRGFEGLMDFACVTMGCCGSIKDGEPIHVTDLIPRSGPVTADQFIDWLVEAEDMTLEAYPAAHREKLRESFVANMGAPIVDASRLRWR